MNKIFPAIAIALLINVQAFAFFDLFQGGYSKKNNDIHDIILTTLNTSDGKKWKRVCPPYKDSKGEIYCTYIPENEDRYNRENSFILIRYEGEKDQKYRTGNDVWLETQNNSKKSMKFIGEDKRRYCREFAIKMITPDQNSLCFERYITIQDITDPQNLGPIQPDINIRQLHQLIWIIDHGQGRLHMYEFTPEKRFMPPEEIAHMLNIFKKIEEQIKDF